MKRTLGAYISFTGIDGVGKSTQARLLHGHLSGVVTDIVFHEDSRNFVAEVAYTIAHRAGKSTGRELLGEDSYIIAMSFEVVRQTLCRINPLVQRGVTIVSSRTVYDWLAGTRVRQCGEAAYSVVKEVLLFGGLPSLTIWLDTTPAIAQERAIRRGYDSPELAYLEQLRVEYAMLAAEFGFCRIDGDGDTVSVERNINGMISEWMRTHEKET